MKKLTKTFCLIAGLLVAPAAWAYQPIACSQCDCRTACGTLCKESSGLFSVCGVDGNWCEISPVCQGSAAASETPAGAPAPDEERALAAFLDSLAPEPAAQVGSQTGL